jgi:predicted dehydrogenase
MLGRAKKGDFGQIYQFRARLPKPIAEYDLFVSDLGRYPGGIFFEMAGHMVDISVSLLGRPKKVTPFLAHHHHQPGKFIDNALAVFEYDRAFATLEVAALEVAPHQRRFEVYGTRGAAIIPHLGSGHVLNSTAQPVQVFSAGEKDWKLLEPEAATLQIADLREFASTLAGKKEPDYNLEHDLIVHETLLAASGMLD